MTEPTKEELPQYDITGKHLRDMQAFALELHDDVGPMFGRDVRVLIAAYRDQQEALRTSNEELRECFDGSMNLNHDLDEARQRIEVLTQERDATVLALDEARAKVAELEEELRKRSVNHPLLAQPRREEEDVNE